MSERVITDYPFVENKTYMKYLELVLDIAELENKLHSYLESKREHIVLWKHSGTHLQRGIIKSVAGIPGSTRLKVFNLRTNKLVDVKLHQIEYISQNQCE